MNKIHARDWRDSIRNVGSDRRAGALNTPVGTTSIREVDNLEGIQVREQDRKEA